MTAVPELFDNPVRHSIGSSDPGLEIESPHGIRMVISHGDQGARNWLPCPPGQFFLVLRIYAPGRCDFRSGGTVASS